MADLMYTKDHEWVRTEGDTSTVGITDFAQNALGDVVYVDLPEVGQTFAAGETIGEIESTKSVGELIVPAAGEVVAVNEAVADDPTLVNSAPTGDGWLVQVKFTEQPELIDEAAYRELTA